LSRLFCALYLNHSNTILKSNNINKIIQLWCEFQLFFHMKSNIIFYWTVYNRVHPKWLYIIVLIHSLWNYDSEYIRNIQKMCRVIKIVQKVNHDDNISVNTNTLNSKYSFIFSFKIYIRNKFVRQSHTLCCRLDIPRFNCASLLFFYRPATKLKYFGIFKGIFKGWFNYADHWHHFKNYVLKILSLIKYFYLLKI